MNDYALAVLLGVIEGVTEFLPISSTGHMLLMEQIVKVDFDEDRFWKLFTVVIQLGAILAVVVYYAGRLRALLVDFFATRRSSGSSVPRWRHPLVLVLAAVIPAGIIGVAFKKQIDDLMERALPIGLALVLGGAAIAIIERRREGRDRVNDISGVSPWQALAIGFSQAVALVPGVSRSAATIMGGRLCGLTTAAAADFSFLLSIPTMLAAAVYTLYKHRVPLTTDERFKLCVGFVTAFIIAFLVVAWFLRFLRHHGLGAFVIYRMVLGLVVIGCWGLGWLK